MIVGEQIIERLLAFGVCPLLTLAQTIPNAYGRNAGQKFILRTVGSHSAMLTPRQTTVVMHPSVIAQRAECCPVSSRVEVLTRTAHP
jgi:hypothetical protein